MLELTQVYFPVQTVHAELESAKLQVSTLKAELVISHKAADSARAASDSLAQQMRMSADTELLNIVQKVDAAEAEAHRLHCMLASTEAHARSEAAKLQLSLEKSQANVASAQQDVHRLEQQLAGSQTAAAQQQEELKKLHQTELKLQVQAACISLLLPTAYSPSAPASASPLPTCHPPPPPQLPPHPPKAPPPLRSNIPPPPMQTPTC